MGLIGISRHEVKEEFDKKRGSRKRGRQNCHTSALKVNASGTPSPSPFSPSRLALTSPCPTSPISTRTNLSSLFDDPDVAEDEEDEDDGGSLLFMPY